MKKKQIAIALLIVGVLGFIYAQNQKKNYLIFEDRISSKDFSKEFYVETGNEYMYSVWGTDEEGAARPSANLEVDVQLLDRKGRVLEEKHFTGTNSDNDGGLKRATNGYDIRYNPEENGEVILKSTLVRGDYVDVEVYENLPGNTYWLPVFFIAVFITGLILFLKARASVNAQEIPIPSKINKTRNKMK